MWPFKKKKEVFQTDADTKLFFALSEIGNLRTRLRKITDEKITLRYQLEEMTERWKHAKEQKEKHRLEKAELKKQLSALTPNPTNKNQ